MDSTDEWSVTGAELKLLGALATQDDSTEGYQEACSSTGLVSAGYWNQDADQYAQELRHG